MATASALDQALEAKDSAERIVARFYSTIKMCVFFGSVGLFGIPLSTVMCYGGPSPIHNMGYGVMIASGIDLLAVLIFMIAFCVNCSDKKSGIGDRERELLRATAAYRRELEKVS